MKNIVTVTVSRIAHHAIAAEVTGQTIIAIIAPDFVVAFTVDLAVQLQGLRGIL